MFERELSETMVVAAVRQGEIITAYPDDTPYPSWLMLWFHEGFPIHVVVARNLENGSCYIITAYIPSERLWDKAFKEREKS